MDEDPIVANPIGRGWKVEKNGAEDLVLHWMNGQPAPQAILDLLACNCSKKCALSNCECVANGLKCTDMCRLLDCENQVIAADEENMDCQDDKLEDDFEY